MDENLNQIADGILESYRVVGGINNIDGSNLPSKRAIASICEDLLQLLFPGFHDEEPIHSMHLRKLTVQRVESIAGRLKTEVCKSLHLKNPASPDSEAEAIVQDFLKALPCIRELLWTDVQAAYDGDPAALSYEEIVVAYPFLEAISIQRAAHGLYERKLPLIPRIMTEWAHSRTGIDIHPGAQIGSHFFIDHGTGVVIGETTEIGSDVKLYHGVTLGARSTSGVQQLRGRKRHPTVEDGVTIYPDSTILGGETVIGAHSTIGGNVILNHSVPANSLVIYEEAQLTITPKRPRGQMEPGELIYDI